MRKSFTRHYGFTLVELIAVITVVGVLAAIAGPKWIGNDVFATRGTQGTLLAALRYAQKTAVAQRRLVYLKLDTSAHTLCLGYNNDCSQSVEDPVSKSPFIKTLNDRVGLAATSQVLGFDGLGRPVPSSGASFTLQNLTDMTQPALQIIVEADTGYVR